jgi:hypothetical protein
MQNELKTGNDVQTVDIAGNIHPPMCCALRLTDIRPAAKKITPTNPIPDLLNRLPERSYEFQDPNGTPENKPKRTQNEPKMSPNKPDAGHENVPVNRYNRALRGTNAHKFPEIHPTNEPRLRPPVACPILISSGNRPPDSPMLTTCWR